MRLAGSEPSGLPSAGGCVPRASTAVPTVTSMSCSANRGCRWCALRPSCSVTRRLPRMSSRTPTAPYQWWPRCAICPARRRRAPRGAAGGVAPASTAAGSSPGLGTALLPGAGACDVEPRRGRPSAPDGEVGVPESACDVFGWPAGLCSRLHAHLEWRGRGVGDIASAAAHLGIRPPGPRSASRRGLRQPLAHLQRDPRHEGGRRTTYTWDSRTGHVRQLPSQPRRGAVPIPGAVYRPADAHPRLVAGRDDSSEVTENPAIASQLIMWTTSERAFAADRRSASATTITPYWGWATGQRPAFFVAYPVPKAKSLHAAQNVSVLPASLLPPLPRCR